MKTIKRLISFLLVICMLAACTACAGGGASDPTPADTGPASAAEAPGSETPAAPAESNELLEYGLLPNKPYDGTKLMMVSNSPGLDQFEMLKKFTESDFTPMTGITVEWDQGPWEGVFEKMLMESVAGSSTFDLFMIMDVWGASLRNYMHPINEYIERDGIDISDFPAPFMEYARMGSENGEIYGLPMRGHFQTIFYRKDIYEELGLNIPGTWDELISNSKTIMEKKPGMYGFSTPYGIFVTQNMMVWYSFFYSHGAEFFDEEMRPVFNSPEAVKATQMYVDLMLKDKIVSPDSVTAGENESRTQMSQGQSAHFMSWSWLLSRFSDPEFASEEVIGNVGTFAVPSFIGNEQAQTAVSEFCVGIPAAASQKDAAWEYVKFLSSAEVQKKVMMDTSQFQTNTLARTSVMLDPDINNLTGGLWEFGAKTLANARTTPTNPEWNEVAALIEQAINNCASGKDVQAELDAAVAGADTIMKAAGYYS